MQPKAPNTLDYDPNNPEHAHIKRNIGLRMIAGFVHEHIQENLIPKRGILIKLPKGNK